MRVRASAYPCVCLCVCEGAGLGIISVLSDQSVVFVFDPYQYHNYRSMS